MRKPQCRESRRMAIAFALLAHAALATPRPVVGVLSVPIGHADCVTPSLATHAILRLLKAGESVFQTLY